MFECSSLFILMHLDGLVLIIADRCHICFACHFQTVHPIPVIFISISTEINSSFQWHILDFQVEARFMLSLSHLAYASRIASRIAYHPCIILFDPCTWLIVSPFACCSCLGRAGIRVRERGARWVRLRGSSQLWELCRQDDHTLEITSIFAC